MGITKSLPPAALQFLALVAFYILLHTFIGVEKLLQLLINPIDMSD